MSNKSKFLLFFLFYFAGTVSVFAASNQILSTAVRKVSDNSVNFTFYTKGDNLEKPIVKNKGNNEYTILLPNLSDSTSRGINISQTGGIVTSADVKTINEGAVTYTKVNVKTSKPVTINAETRKTTQTASDVSNINSIVSKVNLINQDVQSTKNSAVDMTQSRQNTQQPVVKAASVKDIIRQNSAAAPKRNAIQESIAVNNVTSHTPDTKKIEKNNNSSQKDENIKNIKPVSNVTHKPKVNVNSKPAVKAVPNKSVNNVQPVKMESIAISNLATIDSENEILPTDNEVLINENTENTNISNDFATEKNKLSLIEGIKEILLSPFTTIILLTCALFAFFAFLFRKLTSNLSVSKSINDSLIEKLNSVINKPKKKDFTNIVNDEKMTWQEKYRAFNETNNKEQAQEHKVIDDNYVFELSDTKSHDDNIEAATTDKKNAPKFKGFQQPSASPISTKIPSKSYKLKSFRKELNSKESVREKLDNIMQEDKSDLIVENSKTNFHNNLENMRILYSTSIDKNREFYVVNDSKEYSLLGRVNNRLVILKKFGNNAPYDLQVRRGQGNNFIVKAGDFKSSVNVSDTDMNILAHV